MSKLVIGNWKMNGRFASLRRLVDALLNDARINYGGVGLAPPVPYLRCLQPSFLQGNLFLVGQDVSQFGQDGAYTGEYSAGMLADCGCTHVLIGHSERRHHLGERDEVLRRKLQHAVDAGLTAVYCVGETLEQRTSGRYWDVIQQQLDLVAGFLAQQLIIAYEPVWAIGTGHVASLEQIASVHNDIKSYCLRSLTGGDRICVLYGGSVNADNAATILSNNSVDGALVGGASLAVESLVVICQAAKLVYNGTSQPVNLGY